MSNVFNDEMSNLMTPTVDVMISLISIKTLMACLKIGTTINIKKTKGFIYAMSFKAKITLLQHLFNWAKYHGVWNSNISQSDIPFPIHPKPIIQLISCRVSASIGHGMSERNMLSHRINLFRHEDHIPSKQTTRTIHKKPFFFRNTQEYKLLYINQKLFQDTIMILTIYVLICLTLHF